MQKPNAGKKIEEVTWREQHRGNEVERAIRKKRHTRELYSRELYSREPHRETITQ